MRRKNWIYIGIALLALAGCGKRQPDVVKTTPQFAPNASNGATAEKMAHAAAQFGIQIYPGAEPDTAHFQAASAPETATRTYLAYISLDPLDKVVTYYKTLGMTDAVIGSTTQLTGVSSTGAALTINVGRDLSAKTRFTITAISQASTPSTQIAATAPMSPSNTANRTYVSPPVTASRDTAEGGWSFSTSNGGPPDSASAGVPAPEQSQPIEAPQQAPIEQPQDEQGMDQTGNEESQNDGPPGDPPL